MEKPFLARIIFLLLALGTGIGYLSPSLIPAFYTNVPLNSLILFFFLSGVFLILIKIRALKPEILWLQGYRQGLLRVNTIYSPFLLSPLASLLGPVEEKRNLSTSSLQLALDTLYHRLQESRSPLKYLVGVLIFLGLLGTFWGLLQTIHNIGNVISNLPVNTGDSVLFFNDLKQGLKKPLGGMGTAFSSSMFGLSCSLILGFFETQLGSLYKKFYQDIEEWLMTLLTEESSSRNIQDPASLPYLGGLIERLSTHMQSLAQAYTQDQTQIQNLQKNVLFLSEKTATLVDYMKTEKDLMIKIAEHQLDLQNIMKHLKDSLSQANHLETTQHHLRNIDNSLGNLLDQLHAHHTQLRSDVKEEIRFLARVLSTPGLKEPL